MSRVEMVKCDACGKIYADNPGTTRTFIEVIQNKPTGDVVGHLCPDHMAVAKTLLRMLGIRAVTTLVSIRVLGEKE